MKTKPDKRKSKGKLTPEQLEARRKRAAEKAKNNERRRLSQLNMRVKERYEDFLHKPQWMTYLDAKHVDKVLLMLREIFDMYAANSESAWKDCDYFMKLGDEMDAKNYDMSGSEQYESMDDKRMDAIERHTKLGTNLIMVSYLIDALKDYKNDGDSSLRYRVHISKLPPLSRDN